MDDIETKRWREKKKGSGGDRIKEITGYMLAPRLNPSPIVRSISSDPRD